MYTPRFMLGYLFGSRDSIILVNRHPKLASVLGAVLVFTAGVAREYDHTLFPDVAFGRPFLFSIISAYLVLGCSGHSGFGVLDVRREKGIGRRFGHWSRTFG